MHDSEDITATARLLEVIARLLVVELDPKDLAGLLQPEVAHLFEEIEPGFTAEVQALSTNPDSQELLDVEFCRLFIMGKATSPLASVWLQGEQLANGAKLTVLVEQWQDALGVGLEDGPWGNAPKDHFAVILGLYSLALMASGGEQLAKQIHRYVLADSLPRFCAAVIQNADSLVYKAVMGLLDQIVARPNSTL